MDLCHIGDIKALLARHGFRFSKGLGQNFLCDPDVPPAIAEGAGIDQDTCVLEVGPGIGTLSQSLCARACKVAAIELDSRLPEVLAETMAAFDNFSLIAGDVLKLDIPALCREQFPQGPVVACANLPYYITSPAISALLDSKCFSSITVMVQKEVAKRICAAPGTADYGAFSVYVQFYAVPRILLQVPSSSFIPMPKVDSAVVRMDVRQAPPVDVRDPAFFFRVVKASFAQRRKILLNCLSAAFPGCEKARLSSAIESCGILPSARGETLSITQFAALADVLEPFR